MVNKLTVLSYKGFGGFCNFSEKSLSERFQSLISSFAYRYYNKALCIFDYQPSMGL